MRFAATLRGATVAAVVGLGHTPSGAQPMPIDGPPACVRDREGKRHSDRCRLAHRHVGQTYEVSRESIRKIYVSKREGGGKDVVVLSGSRELRAPDGSLLKSALRPKVVTIAPGFAGDLLEGVSLADYERIRVETITLGDDGVSRLDIAIEWRVGSPFDLPPP
jgi:hypothetical protein